MNKILNAIEMWHNNSCNIRENYKNLSEFLKNYDGLDLQGALDLIAQFSTALKEIQKGEGRYSRDPLTHADNTIEDLIKLAEDAFIFEQ